MITKHVFKKLTWTDLESPTNEEVRDVMQAHDIHPVVAEELLSPSNKPKLDEYSNYLYIILHFPAIRHTHSNETNQEVDFIIGKDFLITTRYDTIDSIHKFATEFEVSAVIEKSKVAKHGGWIFYEMIKTLYDAVGHELEYIDGYLEKVEDNIFDGKEKQMVRVLSQMSRDLIDIEHTIEHHQEILTTLEVAGAKLFGSSFASVLENIVQEYNKVRRNISNKRDFIHELRSTNDSLLSTKQNEVMKVLTILAFVTFPLSLIASIFGMNTSLPFVGTQGDFWIIISLMVGLTILMFAFFKYKKWL